MILVSAHHYTVVQKKSPFYYAITHGMVALLVVLALLAWQYCIHGGGGPRQALQTWQPNS